MRAVFILTVLMLLPSEAAQADRVQAISVHDANKLGVGIDLSLTPVTYGDEYKGVCRIQVTFPEKLAGRTFLGATSGISDGEMLEYQGFSESNAGFSELFIVESKLPMLWLTFAYGSDKPLQRHIRFGDTCITPP